MRYKVLLIFSIVVWLILHPLGCYSQQEKVDSLLRLIETESADTNKSKGYMELANAYSDTSKKAYAIKLALEYAKKSGHFLFIANAEAKLGYYYEFTAMDYPLAMYWGSEALKVSTENNYEKGIAQCNQQLGIIFMVFEDHNSAINCFKDAATINKKLNRYNRLISNYEMIGTSYSALEMNDSAMIYYREAQKICITNKQPAHVLYVNMTACFLKMKQLDSAEYYIHLTDSVYKERNAGEFGNAWVAWLQGQLLSLRNDYSGAITFLQAADKYAAKENDTELLLQELPTLSETYKKLNRFEEGYYALERYRNLFDSINGNKQTTKILAIQKKFEEEQLIEIQRLKKEKDDAVHGAELKLRNRVILGIAFLFLLAVLFGLYVFKEYKNKQKTNLAIVKQKEIIEEKQKEILDSIHYAKRIQRSLLPTEKYISKSIQRLKK